MPEPAIPPLSASVDEFRTEVGHRADVLRRRRRGRGAGGVAGALALVVVASLVAVHAGAPTAHVSASGAGHAPRSAGIPAPEPRSAGAATSTAASPQLGTGQSTNSGEFGADAPGGFAVIEQRPSGASVTAGVGAKVLVVLPTTRGRWGRAAVAHGKDAVLTVVSQGQVSGTTQVVLRTHRPGTGSVTVPVIGRPGEAWRGTVVVTGTG